MSERPVLRAGAVGNAVGELQQLLGAAGLTDLSGEPAEYGFATEHAVREFQTKRALRVDGIN